MADLAGRVAIGEGDCGIDRFRRASGGCGGKGRDRGTDPAWEAAWHGAEDDVETAAGMIILAMGKMGAHELNYSSDIDLIVLFDETRFDPGDFYDARHGMVRATRNFCATLSDKTADGYVFRTDLRLRPDPAVTPVCMAAGGGRAVLRKPWPHMGTRRLYQGAPLCW